MIVGGEWLGLLSKFVSSLIQRGIRATAVRAITWARIRLLPVLWLREVHAWSTADLAVERPRLLLPGTLSVVRGELAHLPLLGSLDAVALPEAAARLARGAQLWLVLHEGRAVYSGWVFHGQAPTVAARTGWLRLPPRVANPEDMVTAPDYRGRGLASAMYTRIFDDLEERDLADRVVGKVPLGNTANRRALIKSGWREFAHVELLRIGPWRRIRVHPVSADRSLTQLFEWLSTELASHVGVAMSGSVPAPEKL